MEDNKPKKVSILDLKSGEPGFIPGVVVLPDQEMDNGEKSNLVAYYSGNTPEGDCVVYLGVPYKSQQLFVKSHQIRKASKEEVNFYIAYHAQPTNNQLH